MEIIIVLVIALVMKIILIIVLVNQTIISVSVLLKYHSVVPQKLNSFAYLIANNGSKLAYIFNFMHLYIKIQKGNVIHTGNRQFSGRQRALGQG